MEFSHGPPRSFSGPPAGSRSAEGVRIGWGKGSEKDLLIRARSNMVKHTSLSAEETESTRGRQGKGAQTNPNEEEPPECLFMLYVSHSFGSPIGISLLASIVI